MRKNPEKVRKKSFEGGTAYCSPFSAQCRLTAKLIAKTFDDVKPYCFARNHENSGQIDRLFCRRKINSLVKEKQFQNRTRIRLYGLHSWLKLQPCFMIGGDH